MILSHHTFERSLKITVDAPVTLTVENPRQFAQYVKELFMQSKGSDGPFSLFEDCKEIPISSTEVIVNPFDMDYASKDVQTGIVNEVKHMLNSEKYYTEVMGAISKLSRLCSEALGQIDTNLFCSELDIPNLVKFISPHHENGDDSLLDNIVQYIQIKNRFANRTMFIFVNLKSFFDDEQLVELFRHISYLKVYFLSLESSNDCDRRHFPGKIIDRDLCELDIDKCGK